MQEQTEHGGNDKIMLFKFYWPDIPFTVLGQVGFSLLLVCVLLGRLVATL